MLWRATLSVAIVVLLLLGFGNAYALGWLTWPPDWSRNIILGFLAVMAAGALFYRDAGVAFRYPLDTECSNCNPRCPTPTYWEHMRVEHNVCAADRLICECRKFDPKP